MQVIEINDILASKASIFAENENKSLSEFVSLSLRETLIPKSRQRSDADKIKQFAESYKKFPEQAETMRYGLLINSAGKCPTMISMLKNLNHTILGSANIKYPDGIYLGFNERLVTNY